MSRLEFESAIAAKMAITFGHSQIDKTFDKIGFYVATKALAENSISCKLNCSFKTLILT